MKKSYVKFFIVLIISILTSFYSSAQLPQEKVDSLYNLLNSNPEYEVRVQIYNLLAKHYLTINPGKAVELSQQGLKQSQNAGDSIQINNFYRLLSSINSQLGRYREALHYDRKWLENSRNMKDQKYFAQALNNVGEDYYDMGLYTEAYDYYQHARKTSIEISYDLVTAISTYNVGRVLMAIGQYERSMKYIRNSMDLSRKIDDNEGVAYSYNDLGKIYFLTNKYDKALENLNKAREMSNSLGLKLLSSEVLTNLADVNYEKEDYEQSLANYDSAEVIFDELGNMEGIGKTYLGKAKVLIKKDEDDQAERLLEKSLAVARKQKYGELAKDCYEQLSLLYEERSNYQEALRLYKTLRRMEDSLFSYKKNEEFAKIQILHETEQKDTEIQMITNRVNYEEFKSNILVVVLALAAVLLFNLYRSSTRRKKINNLLLVHQQEIEARSREMKGLLEMKDKFFSIISHDLRSPINALSGLLDMLNEGHLTQNELKEASVSLKKRLDSTRKMLDNLLDWALVQMDEIRMNPESLDLKKIAEENIAFFNEVNDKEIYFLNQVPPGTMIRADKNMVNLVIRNIISNSIKFTPEEGEIKIFTEESGTDLVVCIADNGIGMSQDLTMKLFDSAELYSTPGTANEKGTGLGLKLCKEFVERMEGRIWAESIKEQGSVFKFTIKKADTL